MKVTKEKNEKNKDMKERKKNKEKQEIRESFGKQIREKCERKEVRDEEPNERD